MPDLSLATAFVDLKVRGNLDEQLRRHQQQFQQTTNAARTFANFAGSGVGQKYFGREYTANLQKGNEQLKTATAQLRAQLEVIKSPVGMRALQEKARLLKEQEAITKRISFAEARAQHGTLGALIQEHGGKVAAAGAAAAGVVASTVAAASPQGVDALFGWIKVLAAKIGMEFIPLLARAIVGVHDLIEAWDALEPAVKSFAAMLIGLTAAAGLAIAGLRLVGLGGIMGGKIGKGIFATVAAAVGIEAASHLKKPEERALGGAISGGIGAGFATGGNPLAIAGGAAVGAAMAQSRFEQKHPESLHGYSLNVKRKTDAINAALDKAEGITGGFAPGTVNRVGPKTTPNLIGTLTQPSWMSLEEARRQAQISALNLVAKPWEAEGLIVQRQSLDRLTDIVRILSGGGPAAVGP